MFDSIPPWVCIVLWFILGYSMIIFNKILLTSWGFHYPFLLTAWHSFVVSIITRVLASRTSLLTAVNEKKITNAAFLQRILPVSIFFAFGLGFGNSAYKYLSISYIQMLKSLTPVPTLLAAFLVGKERPSLTQLSIVLIICFGITISTVGEAAFSVIGFMFQIGAMFADVSRMTLMDLLFTDVKIDVLSMLYYMSPASFIFLIIGFYLFEYPSFVVSSLDSGLLIALLLNGLLAFALNIMVVMVVAKTSAVTVSLAGLFKDVSVVVSSVVLFGSRISILQICGYVLSLFGLHMYKEYKSDNEYISRKIQAVVNVFAPWYSNVIHESSESEKGLLLQDLEMKDPIED